MAWISALLVVDMIITALETFILHVPVTRDGIADSTHSITHWGMPGVMIHTDTGKIGLWIYRDARPPGK